MNSHAPPRYPVSLSCIFVCQTLVTAAAVVTLGPALPHQHPLPHSPQRQVAAKQWKPILYSPGKVFSFYYPTASQGPSDCGGPCLAVAGCMHGLLTAGRLSSLDLFPPTSHCVFVKRKLPKERFFWVQLVTVSVLHRAHTGQLVWDQPLWGRHLAGQSSDVISGQCPEEGYSHGSHLASDRLLSNANK